MSGKSADMVLLAHSENSDTDPVGEGLKTSVMVTTSISAAVTSNSNEAMGNIVRYIESLLKVLRLFVLQ